MGTGFVTSLLNSFSLFPNFTSTTYQLSLQSASPGLPTDFPSPRVHPQARLSGLFHMIVRDFGPIPRYCKLFFCFFNKHRKSEP
jgi:hypothetical protein